MAEHFRVEVSDEHGQIVAIETESLAGRDIGESEEATILSRTFKDSSVLPPLPQRWMRRNCRQHCISTANGTITRGR